MKHSLRTNEVLSKKDATDLHDIIYESLFCSTEADLKKLILDIKRIIPFDSAACLMGRKSGQRAVAQYDLINISYPDEWLLNYVTKNYHLIDPIVKENFNRFSIQYWQDTYKKYRCPKQFVKEAEDFGLRKGYSIGQKNLTATEGSLFSFAGNSIEHNLRTETILKLVVPHVHRAFNQLLDQESRTNNSVHLTSREKEILLWLKEGKSSWEISTILSISEDTVNYHIKNLYRKLNTTSRAHAVAIALGTKLIDF